MASIPRDGEAIKIAEELLTQGLLHAQADGSALSDARADGSVVASAASVSLASAKMSKPKALTSWQRYSGNVPFCNLSYFSPENLRLLPFFSILMNERKAQGSVANEAELQRIASYFHWDRFPAGSRLFEEGDRGSELWVILQGEVKMEKVFGTETTHLRTIRSSEWFGEISLTAEHEHHCFRTATATTTAPSLFLVLTRAEYERLQREEPSVARDMVDKILRRRMYSEMRRIHFLEEMIRGRDEVARILAALLEFFQVHEGETVFREGDIGERFFLILEGRVKVTTLDRNANELQLVTLKRDSFFGEIALVYRCPRTATVTAVEPCTMLSLNRAHFARFLRIVPDAEAVVLKEIQSRVIRSLRRQPLLRTLPVDRAPLLRGLFTCVSVQRGEVIFQEGAAADSFQIIVAGACRAVIRGEDGVPICVARLRPGDYMGEIALTRRCVRTASVIADTTCLLATLSERDFAQFKSLVPGMAELLQQQVELRLGRRVGVEDGDGKQAQEHAEVNVAEIDDAAAAGDKCGKRDAGANHDSNRGAVNLPFKSKMLPREAPNATPGVLEVAWKYRDHQGKTHGPFTGVEMSYWARAGFFSPEIQICSVCTGNEFRELHTLFANAASAFTYDPCWGVFGARRK